MESTISAEFYRQARTLELASKRYQRRGNRSITDRVQIISEVDDAAFNLTTIWSKMLDDLYSIYCDSEQLNQKDFRRKVRVNCNSIADVRISRAVAGLTYQDNISELLTRYEFERTVAHASDFRKFEIDSSISLPRKLSDASRRIARYRMQARLGACYLLLRSTSWNLEETQTLDLRSLAASTLSNTPRRAIR